MNKFLIILILYCATAAFSLPVMGQTQSDKPVYFWGKTDQYYMRQAEQTLALIDSSLLEYLPVEGAPAPRKLALFALDGILHDTRYDNSDPLRKFFSRRTAQLINDLTQPVKKNKAKTFKAYNDGFITKTPSVTLAFDLIRGSCKGQQLTSNEDMLKIIEQCDALFITHNHGDHADPWVADQFIKAGKPVVATPDIFPTNKSVMHLRDEKTTDQTLQLANGQKVRMQILPGHQDDMLCNLYVITTPEGFTTAHIGDQYNKDDLEWIPEIHKRIPGIDVLTMNCWAMNIPAVVGGFSPRIVITGHENELDHSVDHREAYWLTFKKMANCKKPYVVMTWGENYEIQAN